ncbi:MAG: flagellar biosynthetic protein FliO, partial [Actinomycetota bacterium]|nr:flagellar biosynthetic protein FliO [Actinomycetota bacterium]
MDSLMLALRLVLSLGFVIGLMWVAARIVRGQVAGRGGGALEVLARQQLGRGSSVAVLRVADQALVVGITESRVTLLGEADLQAVEALVPVADKPAAAAAGAAERPGGRRRRGAGKAGT